MRMALLVVLALAAVSLTPTGADAGAWCATYRWGTTNCGYSSSDQCWASVRGIGGFCRPNPLPLIHFAISEHFGRPFAPKLDFNGAVQACLTFALHYGMVLQDQRLDVRRSQDDDISRAKLFAGHLIEVRRSS